MVPTEKDVFQCMHDAIENNEIEILKSQLCYYNPFDSRRSSKHTLIFYAAKMNRFPMLKLLIERNYFAIHDFKDVVGEAEFLLSQAVLSNNTKMAKYIISRFKPKIIFDIDVEAAFSYHSKEAKEIQYCAAKCAVHDNNIPMLQFLATYDEHVYSPHVFMYAAHAQKIEIMTFLLQQKQAKNDPSAFVDMYYLDRRLAGPRHVHDRDPFDHILLISDAMVRGYTDIVKFLLDHGARIDLPVIRNIKHMYIKRPFRVMDVEKHHTLHIAQCSDWKTPYLTNRWDPYQIVDALQVRKKEHALFELSMYLKLTEIALLILTTMKQRNHQFPSYFYTIARKNASITIFLIQNKVVYEHHVYQIYHNFVNKKQSIVAKCNNQTIALKSMKYESEKDQKMAFQARAQHCPYVCKHSPFMGGITTFYGPTCSVLSNAVHIYKQEDPICSPAQLLSVALGTKAFSPSSDSPLKNLLFCDVLRKHVFPKCTYKQGEETVPCFDWTDPT